MKKSGVLAVVVCVMAAANTASADTFGSGTLNEFTIDFVPISGDAGDLGSWSAGSPYTFSGANRGNYRMGTYEVSNDQWTKFQAAYGAVTGSPSTAYDLDPTFTGESVPTNNVSWYEAAQFINYLNTSTGHQAAYKFTGTIHTSNYTFANWISTDTGYNANNPYRNSNAYYFLPTENEWVKAAYWNGTSLQTYTTKAGDTLFQGNGTNGGWNYITGQYATDPAGPWAVTSGSQELNGTYNMMGNVWEWLESPYSTGDYLSGSIRGLRGGSCDSGLFPSSYRTLCDPRYENISGGFRVASVPEPCSLALLFIGGLMLRRKKY